MGGGLRLGHRGRPRIGGWSSSGRASRLHQLLASSSASSLERVRREAQTDKWKFRWGGPSNSSKATGSTSRDHPYTIATGNVGS